MAASKTSWDGLEAEGWAEALTALCGRIDAAPAAAWDAEFRLLTNSLKFFKTSHRIITANRRVSPKQKKILEALRIEVESVLDRDWPEEKET